jgi:SPP1 family predicted phage head-tail adaptor
MNIGDLDTPIRIVKRKREQDATGQPIDKWEPVANARASIIYRSGYAAITGDADMSINRASFAIFKNKAVEAGMHIEVPSYDADGEETGHTTWRIEAASPMSSLFTTLACSEVA